MKTAARFGFASSVGPRRLENRRSGRVTFQLPQRCDRRAAPTRLRAACAILLVSSCLTAQVRAQSPAPWGSVKIEQDSAGRPVAILENSRIKFRWAHGDETPASFALREITLKKTNAPNADAGATAKIEGSIDFPSESVKLGYVRIAADLPDRKSLLVGWNRDPAERAPAIRRIYSLYPDSTMVRIDYMNGGGSERDAIAAALPDSAAGDRLERDHQLTRLDDPRGTWSLGRLMPADVVERIARVPGGGFEFFVSPRAIYTSYLFAGATGHEVAATGLAIARGELPQKPARSAPPVTRGEFTIDPQWLRIENSQLAIAYSPDPIHNRGPKAGVSEFRRKSNGENYAVSLDAFGAGYALYSIGSCGSEVSHLGDDYVEVTLTRTEQVDVVESYRLFPRSSVLEIEYRRLDLTWWQDFYNVPGDDVVYSIHGLDREIDAQAHAAFRKKAEEAAGHNFGDAFLQAAGADPAKCAHAEHFIFGAYSRQTGRGIGFVMPTRIDLHSGFKLWSMDTYESFPFRWLRKSAEDRAERQKLLPLRRWIFAFDGGREGMFTLGRSIAEAAAAPNLETRAARFAGYVRSTARAARSAGIVPASASEPTGGRRYSKPADALSSTTSEGATGSAVQLTKSATLPSCPGLDFFKIETPAATYYLDKLGAAIASLVDRDGHDWISFRSEPMSKGSGEFRGFPNAVGHRAGAYFHPLNRHTSAANTRVEHESPTRVSIVAESGNGMWAGRYEFFATHCTFTMTKMPPDGSYWVLYEGTPGGTCEDADWWMTSAVKERQPLTTNHEGDIPAPEWIAFGDPKLPRALFVFNHQDDDRPDRSYQQQRQMTVFGFGRHRGEKHLTTVPRSFSIGLVESTDHAAIGRAIAKFDSSTFLQTAR